MEITPETTVADIVTTEPATIRIFQEHHVDFCCGGQVSLADACERHDIDLQTLLDELQRAPPPATETTNWHEATLTELIAHIQAHYHGPLRSELRRLSEMLTKVVSRHSDRLPETLLPLQATFERLSSELLPHMNKEDAVLFPAIVSLEAARQTPKPAPDDGAAAQWAWMDQPMQVMEAEHEHAGEALARLREITHGYAPPADACPTFRGLYYGLAELEREMHTHVHLENNILFPRAARLARDVAA